jgi:NAD-dependent DNA ligase
MSFLTSSVVSSYIKDETLFFLESLYLRSKIKYYEGTPLMDDPTFDMLEEYLKFKNSLVIKQVGAKRKDFDFQHPSPMLSLAKIQMETIDGVVDYKEQDYIKWLLPLCVKIQKPLEDLQLLYSPKFDGNAINAIYINSKLHSVVTRGDGKVGKDVTERLRGKLPEQLSKSTTGMLEIRCEVVFRKDKFELVNKKRVENGEVPMANPRNYVAGLLGSDDYNENAKDLDVRAINFILNGEHLSPFTFAEFKAKEYITPGTARYYKKYIESVEEMRDAYPYQLDGVVIALPVEYRKTLGENDHDPEWSLAIKLISEEASTEIIGIEWNVSKTGELSPVVLLEPVQLAGTIVKRVSGYNAGYIIENKLGNGAIITIIKAGEIIPEIQAVTQPGYLPIIPQACPACEEKLVLHDIHLMCNNPKCCGKMKKRFQTAAKMLDLKGVGPSVMERFSNSFTSMADLVSWVRLNGDSKEIERFGFEKDSQSHKNFMNAFKKLDEISYAKVILLLGYDDVGLKLAEQVSLDHEGLDCDYKGHDRSLVSMLNTEETKKSINDAISKLEQSGIKIIRPMKKKESSSEEIAVVMTGSPKPTWATKEIFLNEFNGKVVDVDSLSDKRCQYLITDSYSSTSSKMKVAEKKGIIVKTYSDFKKENS